jgi:uncharacterized membrane protein YgcG
MTAVLAAAAASGCQLGERYSNAVDPCWPERYSAVARLETLQPFQAQALNGHTLANAVWNYHFEAGTDKLTPAGLQTLDQFVTNRPTIEGRVYLQTTRDIGYDPLVPEKYADTRRDLDERRAKAILKYLAAQTASRPMNFDVLVIDPSDPSFSAKYPASALSQLVGQYRASSGSSAGGGSGGTGGGGTGGSGAPR